MNAPQELGGDVAGAPVETGGEATLFALAYEIEQAQSWAGRKPGVFAE